ncbi:uncharacterized protein METZ01_LOCUS294728 [marine metagenome]|uniref:Uncharacterized protein n=1 Tax=marine metagenome TaxID=408172 RepID=A0A382LYP9_9ZZZZ
MSKIRYINILNGGRGGGVSLPSTGKGIGIGNIVTNGYQRARTRKIIIALLLEKI